jgi:hypothetical protein
MRSGYLDPAIAAWGRSDGLRAGKVYRLVLAAAASDLTPRRIDTLNHYFHYLS